MVPVTPSRRLAAQAALVAGPVMVAVSGLLQPEFHEEGADQLAALDSTGASVSGVLFLVGQLPLLVAFLALGLLLVPTAPRLSAWGTALGVVGVFGHVVFGGLSMTWLVMAGDTANREVYGGLVEDLMDSPVMIFSLAGLVGTVLGFLLLGIGLFRTRTGPVWVGPALWAFLLLEFVGSNLSDYAMYAASLLLAAAFFALVPVVAGRPAVVEAEAPSYTDMRM